MQWTDDEQDEEQIHNILSHVISVLPVAEGSPKSVNVH
jgi:hypothetical protein